mmetsp:Transcript_18561/g.29458  ORF Transcript_18561/g.29458 Transcript_18561/m.29458 type:complete len:209 (-) Transcript_18561:262-888(-)
MHTQNMLLRQPIMHQTEHALLHLAAIPRAANQRRAILNAKRAVHVRVQPMLLPLFVVQTVAVDDGIIRLEVLQLLLARIDEHVLDKVLMPRLLGDKTYAFGRRFARATKAVVHVHIVDFIVIVINRLLLEFLVQFQVHLAVHIAPPNFLRRWLLIHNIFIQRTATGKFASINRKCAVCRKDAFFVSRLMICKLAIGQVSIAHAVGTRS